MSNVNQVFDGLFESLGRILRPPMRRDLIDNVKFDGIDHKDAPDYCDAFICKADYNGKPMTKEQLDEINDDTDWKYERLLEHLY